MAFIRKVKATMAALAVGAMVCVGSAAFAQQTPGQGNKADPPAVNTQDISEEDLKQFVQAGARAAAVQEGSQRAMMAVVEEEKLSLEKFMEMTRANQAQKLDQVQATPEERMAFDKAAQRIIDMQPQMEQSMQQAIEQEGMSLEKFEQIMLAYQQSADVQARVEKLLEQQP